MHNSQFTIHGILLNYTLCIMNYALKLMEPEGIALGFAACVALAEQEPSRG